MLTYHIKFVNIIIRTNVLFFGCERVILMSNVILSTDNCNVDLSNVCENEASKVLIF